MPSRSVRRRQHKRLEYLENLPKARRAGAAADLLVGWESKAHRLARKLTTTPVWDLTRDPEIQAKIRAVDPAAELELEADLDRVCVEAVASAAGRHLTGGSRPLADRARHSG